MARFNKNRINGINSGGGVKYLIIILILTGCSSIPDYEKAMNECYKLRDLQQGWDENESGDEGYLAKGYFYGCVDAKTKGN